VKFGVMGEEEAVDVFITPAENILELETQQAGNLNIKTRNRT
jgi:hypothetical protein